MKPSQILYFVGLVFIALFLFMLSRKGTLKGMPRVAAFAALGLAVLGWVAKLLGW
jgi:hypothetical protein